MAEPGFGLRQSDSRVHASTTIFSENLTSIGLNNKEKHWKSTDRISSKSGIISDQYFSFKRTRVLLIYLSSHMYCCFHPTAASLCGYRLSLLAFERRGKKICPLTFIGLEGFILFKLGQSRTHSQHEVKNSHQEGDINRESAESSGMERYLRVNQIVQGSILA